jgi:hypothetical protein
MIVDTHISNSERNRPAELGGENIGLPPKGEEEAPRATVGGVMKAEDVAERVLDGIRTGRLYVLTHEESRPFIRRRFERIDRSFES